MSVTGSIQKAEKEIVIDYNISAVKRAVMIVFEKLPKRYLLRKDDINEIFNTYRFPATHALYPGMIDLTLHDVDGTKTQVKISVTALHGSVSSNTTLNGVMNDYLKVLSMVLSGATDDDIKESIKQTGCMVYLVVGTSLLGLLSLI